MCYFSDGIRLPPPALPGLLKNAFFLKVRTGPRIRFRVFIYLCDEELGMRGVTTLLLFIHWMS